MHGFKKYMPPSIWNLLRMAYHCFINLLMRISCLRFLFIGNALNRIILIGAPNHGNCGDIAIALAQRQFLSQYCEDAKLINVGMAGYYTQIRCWQRFSHTEDIFVLIGGGNFGNQYMQDELIRRDLIVRFPDNKIIMFPQSIYFTNDAAGQRELRITQEIYNAHKKLVLTARDRISYELIQRWFTNKVLLVPDIVLYMERTEPSISRTKALLCLRSDLEGILSVSQKDRLRALLKHEYGRVDETTTIVQYRLSKTGQNKLLEKKLLEFQSAKVVITDRIHGMIFAAITSTPCVVLSNYNHKVRGAYEWLKELKFIQFAEKVDQVQECLDHIRHIAPDTYKNEFLKEYFHILLRELGRSMS